MLSFSQVLPQETGHRGVTALCHGPTTTGFLDALQNAEASQTAVYAKLAEPGPVVDAGLRALDRGIPVVVPELHNQAIAFLPRITPPPPHHLNVRRVSPPRLPSSVLEKRPGSP